MEAAGDVTVPKLALILIAALFAASTVAKPELLMLTAAGTDDTQVTDDVTFDVVPSLYVAVAVYCWVALSARVTLAGERLMDFKSGGTVIVAAGEATEPSLAFILIVFCAPLMTVARPLLLIVTRAAFDVVHVTDDVIFAVVPLLYVPVAAYCCVPARGNVTLVGERLMDVNATLAAAWLA
jgi:hypothetical protein